MPLETDSVGIVYRIFAAGAQLRELVTVEALVAPLLKALLKKSTIDNFHARKISLDNFSLPDSDTGVNQSSTHIVMTKQLLEYHHV